MLAVSGKAAQRTKEQERKMLFKYRPKDSVKKAKKMDAHKQCEDPSVENDEVQLRGVPVIKKALETTCNSFRNIPPHDPSATTSEMAYPLDKIILSGEWDFLSDILQLLQIGDQASPTDYPSFICNRISKLEDVGVGCCFLSWSLTFLLHVEMFVSQFGLLMKEY